MLLWGDLHNHCAITYGFGSLKNALEIAKSHLDFCCVTGHAMWSDIYKRTKNTEFIVDFHRKGFKKLLDNWDNIREEIASCNSNELVTFQSYEMHSSKYGDHHIISPDDKMPLIYKDSPEELVNACGVRAIAVPHHIGYTSGYRGINWDLFNSNISPCVEVYSKHGCAMSDYAPFAYYHDMGPRDSRNTVYEGLLRKNQFCFLGSTDHHAGFPGSYGDGLTAVITKEKSREAIWDALLKGRAYAVTGDRIECNFTINDKLLGETVNGKKRRIFLDVKCDYLLDKAIIYKNCKPIAFLCGEQLSQRQAQRYKIRVEMGWGNSEELTIWNGSIETDGQISGVNLYLRGRSLLSPTNHDGSTLEVNDISNKVINKSENKFQWCCETVRNKSTLHPQTDIAVVEIKGDERTKVSIMVNGRVHSVSIKQLLCGGTTWHTKEYHSEAVKIHTAIQDWEYSFNMQAVDYGVDGIDVYHAEISQKNGHWAFISPIYAQLN